MASLYRQSSQPLDLKDIHPAPRTTTTNDPTTTHAGLTEGPRRPQLRQASGPINGSFASH
jgi:hypothetical protein